MNIWTKVSLVSGIVLLSFVAFYGVARSHCEIPCGIYGDQTRILLLNEHIATIEKSMKMIGEEKDNPNQLVRWVNNKEKHANEFQHIVTQYFMTQRIKPKAGEEREKYLTQITTLHEMLIAAMKCKQTTDVTHTQSLSKLVDRFSASYFSAEDLKHIKEHHGKK